MRKIQKAVILFFLAFKVFLYGASIEIPSITINNPQSQTFVDVNIYFSSEKNFTGYQLTIQYNQQVLKVLDAQKGPAVSLFTTMTNTNNPGIIKIAGFNPTLSGISGNGILATLKFQIINPGYSNLILSSVKLSDATGQTIQCSASSGSVRIGQPSQKPENQKPSDEETKPKEKPLSISAKPSTPKPEPTTLLQKSQESQVPVSLPENMDIDELLTILEMEKTSESKENSKDMLKQKSSDTVTLLVLSEYGNPFPSVGITSFTKGDKINARVESEILLSDTEKVICIGCEGKGSAFNAKTNILSFIIERDSKILWKWKKVPVDPGIIIETANEIKTDDSEKQISIPVKVRFLGNLNKSIYITAESRNLDVHLTETCFIPEKNQATILLKKNDALTAGRYTLYLQAQSEDKKTVTRKNIDIVSYGYASVGEVIIDETSKTVRIPVNLIGSIKNISSFGIELNIDKTIKFIGIEPLPDVKVFSGTVQKGNIIEIKGGFIPSFDLNNRKIFNLVIGYLKNFTPDMVKITGISLWNEKGESIPISYPKK